MFFLLWSPAVLSAGTATLSWTPPATRVDGGALTNLAGYKVYYGTAAGNYTQSIDVGNVTTYSIPTLDERYPYYFVSAAYDTNGYESDFSNEACKSFSLPAPPGCVFSSSFTNVASNGLTIHWSSAAPQGSAYYAELSTDSFATVNFASTTLNLSAWFGQGGAGEALSPNTTYYLRMSTAASGPYASLGSTVTLADVPTSAASTFTSVSLTSMTVAWLANGNPPALTAYTVVLSTWSPLDRSLAYNVELATIPASSPAATLTGLSSNVVYYLFVRAVNQGGTPTEFAALGSTKTLGADISSPTVPSGLAAAAAGSSRVDLSWAASADDVGVTGYRVRRDGVEIATTTALSWTDVGLDSATLYAYAASAYDAAGNESGWSVSASTRTGSLQPLPYENSLFGLHPAHVAGAAQPFAAAQSMGVRWHRPSTYMAWFIVQADTGSPTLDFSSYDLYYASVPAGINVLGNIVADDMNNSHGYRLPASFTPIDAAQYREFVRAAVERYDGDGFQDAPGLASPIRYWQVGNEPSAYQGTDFAAFQLLTSQAIKEACAQCRVLIGGMPQYLNAGGFITDPAALLTEFNNQYRPILQDLGGSGFDIFDFHWYGGADGDYERMRPVYAFLRSTLNSYGFGAAPIWVTEMGAYSGSPQESWTPSPRTQSEGEQAADYLKRFVLSRALGVEKVFPAFGLIEGFQNADRYFDHTGFIYDGLGSGDPGLGVPKLSYYGYRKMTEKLEGSDWTGAQAVQESSGGAHAYRLAKDGAPLWVAWTDGGQSSQTTLSGLSGTALLVTEAVPHFSSGGQVADYATAFSSRIVAISDGQAAIVLSSSAPVFVESYADVSSPTAPSGLFSVSVSSSRIDISWTASADDVGVTGYAVYRAAAWIASTTANSYSDGSLSPGTTYAYSLAAYDAAGNISALSAESSTMTAAAAPAVPASPFSSVSTTGLTAAWSSNGNPEGTAYSVQLSSTPDFSPILQSSGTTTPSVSLTSLSPNTSYYVQAAAFDPRTSTWTAFVALGSTATLAAASGATAAAAVSSTAVSLDWSPNGNPEPGTRYELWRDISSGFASPVITAVSTSGVLIAGLSPKTTYYFKVRAVNHGGTPTVFDAAASTMTWPPPPGQPGTPSGAAIGVSSISWTWSSAQDGQSYRIYQATNTSSLIASAETLSFVQTGLSPNAAYGVVVAAANPSGEGPLSPSSTVYTLAAPPFGAAASAVTASSATISWDLNANPAGTSAEVQRSTDNAVFTGVFTGAATSMTDYGLLGCTTYYFRVRNRNGGGAATDFDSISFKTSATTPTAAGGLAAGTLAGNRIGLSWTPSPTEGVTAYRLYYDGGSGTIGYGAPLAVLTSTETSHVTGVLPSSAAYAFALRAEHRCGTEETTGVFASAASSGALASVSAAIRSPDAGKRVKGNSVSIIAELARGTPDRVRQVAFQYRPSGTTSWNDVPAAGTAHPNPDADAPYFIHADVTSWPAGNYDLRAVAIDVDGSSDAAPPAVTVASDPAAATIDESLSGADAEKRQTLDNVVGGTVWVAGRAADAPMVKIALPAGALAASTVTVTAVSNPTITAAPPAGSEFAGSAVQVDLSNGQSNLSGGLSASLTLSYPASIVKPDALGVYSLDSVTGRWDRLATTALDSANRTITARTPHFSVFAVIVGGSAAPDLSAVRVYPVPFKPNGGDPDQGKPYSAGDATSGVIFDNLPLAVAIKIYTLSGRLIAAFDTQNCSTGKIQWDAANSDGRPAASGGYFAVVSSPGRKSVIKKLAIIR